MPEFVTVPAVELARVGTWAASTGPWTVTATSIADAVRASTDGAFRPPVIKLGHTDPRFDGQPAVGTVRNLRASADGQALIGDLVGVPNWLAEQMPHSFPSRSVEGLQNVVTASGARYSFLLTGLALLGVTTPAIQTLADVQGLYEAVAANGQAFTFDGSVAGVLTEVTASDPTHSSAASASEATDAHAGASTEEEGAMPDTTLRDLLRPHVGFTEDADDQTVANAIIETLTERADPTTVEVVPEAVAAAARKADLLEVEVRNLSAQLSEIRASQAETELSAFLSAAVTSGRIKPAEQEHFGRLYVADPVLAAEMLGLRAAGSAVALSEIGSDEAPDVAEDAEFDSLFTRPVVQEG